MTIKFKNYGDYLGDGDYKIHDDIQIEGFSLQESLLKYFKKREIDKNVINYQKDKESEFIIASSYFSKIAKEFK